MKKICLALAVVLTCSLATGCTDKGIEALKESYDSLKEQVADMEIQKLRSARWYKSEEFSQALRLFDEYIETNGEQAGVSEKDTLQLVKLDKISDRYFLAAYMVTPVSPYTNNFYTLVDMEKEECTQVNLDSVDYIKDVTYDKSFISFNCEGQNVINGFRMFPHIIKYDIAKGSTTTEYLYEILQYGKPEISLGNSMNEVGLDEVIENNKSILFSFVQTEGTILAGGMFSPTIKTGVKQEDNQENGTLYLDFKALVLSKEVQQQIMELKKLDYVSDISIRSYKDMHEIPHVVVYFKFKSIKEYSCSFQEDSSNGFMDFMLKLR